MFAAFPFLFVSLKRPDCHNGQVGVARAVDGDAQVDGFCRAIATEPTVSSSETDGSGSRDARKRVHRAEEAPAPAPPAPAPPANVESTGKATSSEFAARTGDPDYDDIGADATAACEAVDPRYTKRFLESVQQTRDLLAG